MIYSTRSHPIGVYNFLLSDGYNWNNNHPDAPKLNIGSAQKTPV